MKNRKGRKSALTAKTADKYDLYQRAVQSADADIRFLARIYKAVRGRPAYHFREDFCGTALLTATWIKRGMEYTGEGFDIDPTPLGWGRTHNFAPLGKNADRGHLHQKDVREPSRRSPDIRCAQNFSYCVFKARPDLMNYFKAVYKDLASKGMFVLDLHGGPESMKETEEQTKINGRFTYIWDQHEYWPVTGETKCYIHFRFRDGTEMRRAFVYDWRLWSLTELKDALYEAGFPLVDCYWEGTDSDGESGNGVFRRTRRGENCESFIAYLAAFK
ncbi:MAG: class I SAM-dependent methyltransferase [Acidiferrobacterales bacterium]